MSNSRSNQPYLGQAPNYLVTLIRSQQASINGNDILDIFSFESVFVWLLFFFFFLLFFFVEQIYPVLYDIYSVIHGGVSGLFFFLFVEYDRKDSGIRHKNK